MKMKAKVYDFPKGFAMFIASKDVTERDIKGDEDKIKLFLKDIGYKQRVNVDDKYIDISNFETPIKTNNNVPGKFRHELGSKAVEEFILIKPKTYSFKNGTAKAKGIKKENKGKHEDYYNALMDNEERIYEECRIQNVGGTMSTIKTNKRNLNNFDDKRFNVNNIKAILIVRIYIYSKEI